ncbi:hypothetical protein E2C01_056106 [Portunus trituberculatus]|uniref:Uncharacterized protein n=1 Tax=Portunus trituberculatus TaxID=210409 RepID=A0A5B7GWP3_PORTR|nr:hypothetical protein [Portunus trituberculatus]
MWQVELPSVSSECMGLLSEAREQHGGVVWRPRRLPVTKVRAIIPDDCSLHACRCPIFLWRHTRGPPAFCLLPCFVTQPVVGQRDGSSQTLIALVTPSPPYPPTWPPLLTASLFYWCCPPLFLTFTLVSLPLHHCRGVTLLASLLGPTGPTALFFLIFPTCSIPQPASLNLSASSPLRLSSWPSVRVMEYYRRTGHTCV